MPEQSGDNASTTPAGGSASWECYVTSAIGADHVRARRPNEDAVATDAFELGDGSGVDGGGVNGGSVQVLAVADGHGHMRHFRSDRGSKLAVTAAVAAVRTWAASNSGRERLTSARAAQLVSDVVARWRQLVADDLRADPIGQDQLATIPAGDPPEIPYGATLLLAVLTAQVAVLAQIGDGEMLLILPDGRHLEPVPGDARLDGTRTTSLCQPDAVSAFRVGLVNLVRTPAYAIFAATDGYGNAQADLNWQGVFAADLVRLGCDHDPGWIGGQLAQWAAACASSDGSADDTTAALALNTAAVLTAPERRSAKHRKAPERTTQLRTLPSRPVSDADKTLIWPDQPADAEPMTATAPVLAVPLAASPPPTGPPPTGPPPTTPLPTAPPPTAPFPTAPPPTVPPAQEAWDLGPTSPTAPRWMATWRLWLAGAVVVVIIVAASVYFLTRGAGSPSQPSLQQTHKATATPKASKSTGSSTGGQPKPTPKPSGNLGGGASDVLRASRLSFANAGSSTGNGRRDD